MVLSQFLPPNLIPDNAQAFIAGGYAACPERASDIDVWVHDPTNLLDLKRAELLGHLALHGFAYEPETAVQGVRIDGGGYDEMFINIQKVAVIRRPNGLPIHLMVTDAPAMAVLQHFDISTHQCAIVPQGKWSNDFKRGPDWTALDVEPVAIRETSATSARMDKIRNRYADYRQGLVHAQG